MGSLVDSIQAPPQSAVVEDESNAAELPAEAPPPETTKPSPSARHRALADALFGVEDRSARPKAPTDVPPPAQITRVRSERSAPSPTPAPASLQRADSPLARDDTPKPNPISVAMLSPSLSSEPSSLNGHGTQDPIQLAIDVQRRAEAATIALRKTPSTHRPVEGNGSVRRKISPSLISSPTLMSASTSVDTIPLRSPPESLGRSQPAQVQGSSSKLTSRFKRLRGTLRSKPAVTDDESHQTSPEKSPPSAQSIIYTPPPDPVIASAGDSVRFKTTAPPVASPPASAGPGLKGFMSRFRKQRPAESAERQPRQSTSSVSSPASTLSPKTATYLSNNPPQVLSAPATKVHYNMETITARSPTPARASPIPDRSAQPNESASAKDEAALKQLFDAANNLGLDPASLSELLARSPSTSSRTNVWLSRSNSVAEPKKSRHSTRSPLPLTPVEGRPSIDATLASVPRSPTAEIRQLNIRKNSDQVTPRANQTAFNDKTAAVVRRTIIFPSDIRASTLEMGNLTRKQSTSKKRRSAGAGSVQSKGSLQDRAPTPPPPRGGKRFSHDASPPLPHIPHSFGAQYDNSLNPGPVEKSNSTYDSL